MVRPRQAAEEGGTRFSGNLRAGLVTGLGAGDAAPLMQSPRPTLFHYLRLLIQ